MHASGLMLPQLYISSGVMGLREALGDEESSYEAADQSRYHL